MEYFSFHTIQQFLEGRGVSLVPTLTVDDCTEQAAVAVVLLYAYGGSSHWVCLGRSEEQWLLCDSLQPTMFALTYEEAKLLMNTCLSFTKDQDDAIMRWGVFVATVSE
eukprot:3079581-Amphidinium_carterae.2